jgi:hypothetical protein
MPVYFANLFISFVTCTANSLVGTSISACIGPLRFTLVSIGNEKAAVLPVPVCACPTTSTPFKIRGMDVSCIGKGISYPFSLSAFRISAPSPNC